jgi:NADP-dependent 3-hydroxy acid dehydrogenase YdfG
MDLGIKNKVALVTGGASGIGRAVVHELAENGCKVFFTSRKMTLSSEFKESKNYDFLPQLLAINAASEDGPKMIFEELAKAGVNVDILVNNIGDTLGILDPFCSLDDWRKIYRLNLECHIEINNLFLPKMIENRWIQHSSALFRNLKTSKMQLSTNHVDLHNSEESISTIKMIMGIVCATRRFSQSGSQAAHP